MNDGVKTIGVLTSGGDAPGMNAAVRAVVRTGDCLRLSGRRGFRRDIQDCWRKRS